MLGFTKTVYKLRISTNEKLVFNNNGEVWKTLLVLDFLRDELIVQGIRKTV